MSKTSVHFDNPSKIYYPGQVISGSVDIEIKKPLSARDITVTANGYCKVNWRKKSGKKENHIIQEEKYYKLESMVWGNGSSTSELPPGNHTFEFNFVLPHNIPASIMITNGSKNYAKVVHEIKVNFNLPWAIDDNVIVPYKIVTPLDLNKDPKAKVPIRVSNAKYICCLCCRSGPISAILRVDRSGYLPGENILINAEVTNMSERMVQSTAKLIRVIKFGKFLKVRETMSEEIDHPTIKNDTDFWQSEALSIPKDLCPSYLEHCGIMDINYYLVLELKISKTALNLGVESEIIIGTNLSEGTNNHGSGIPVTAPPTSVSAFEYYKDDTAQPPVYQSQYGLGTPSQYGMGAQNFNTPASAW